MKRYTVFTNAKWRSGKPSTFEVKASNIEEAWESAKSSNVITANELEVENVMLHFSELESYLPVEDATYLQETYQHRLVCPECVEHPQGEPSDVHDCKTVFMKDGKAHGQCLCYSKEHGLRGE